jgi:hypothetical protein
LLAISSCFSLAAECIKLEEGGQDGLFRSSAINLLAFKYVQTSKYCLVKE